MLREQHTQRHWSIRDAIDAYRDEQRFRADLEDYRRNVRVGRVERDDAFEERLLGYIADAVRRQGCPADDPPEFETPDLLTLF